MESNSRWADIFRKLKEKGFNVYSPSTKTGECKEKYLVVKNEGSTAHATFSTDISFYSILVYVPRDKYSILDEYVQEVKKCMKELYPMIIPYGSETPSTYDDSVKAHMVSIMYKNYKKC